MLSWKNYCKFTVVIGIIVRLEYSTPRGGPPEDFCEPHDKIKYMQESRAEKKKEKFLRNRSPYEDKIQSSK